MLEEEVVLDKIEVMAETGFVYVRHQRRVTDDGVVIASEYRRHAIARDGDLTDEDPLVQAVATSAWSGIAAPVPPTPPNRIIDRGPFMDRFSIPTQMALEAISEQQNDAGRLVRIFTRRLEAQDTVNLDSPALTEPLAEIRGLLLAAGVPGWSTAEDADARVAEILA